MFHDDAGNPSEYAQGHGDLVDAFRDSGLLARFVEQGGRTLMLANLDNLGATLDAAVTGWHLAHDADLTCEVVEAGSDRGGWPVRWNGRPVILEDFRLPDWFDPATAGVFNTNTFHVDAALAAGARGRLDLVPGREGGRRPDRRSSASGCSASSRATSRPGSCRCRAPAPARGSCPSRTTTSSPRAGPSCGTR